MWVRPSLAVLALLPALAACGGGGEVTMPPLTPEPADSRLTDTGGDERRTLPARLVLYRFLRGVAKGNVAVCAYLAPAYERTAFGRPGGCRAGLGRERAKLGPRDLAALRGVTVPTGEAGPGAGEVTVRFEDLKWRGEPAGQGGLLASSFTLRRTGGRWLIAEQGQPS
ncbi:hypothetical protein [Actinomadura litoris]|uniref:Nuclear transport factor 2 family protein n=1 Tax=Actinomadura litoris TaxID=2678616 RepID=A0A7K1KWR9_9ACTN|nr:hypothetical protein [Actinomadura litoris]MUN36640.1 hypothetical protein [Actinomadura litoris]